MKSFLKKEKEAREKAEREVLYKERVRQGCWRIIGK